ncbi:MAG: Asp-tRNA(Asn)/Glu-tRNA(Gln) amidotransferase subunit GatA [Calditerrivibrio sp.]|nr:Asp-tRNA(Asn)/Glu-tRNA(Gln) amidotransferase subunit GatA [Calditerrivibrio sp.]
MDLLNATLKDHADFIKNKKISSKEMVEFYLKRVEKYDPVVNAFISINYKAIEEAKAYDEQIAKGTPLPPFAGVPIALKDNMVTKDLLTTCGSRILENFIPPYDGTVVRLLKDAGFIILGKLNMDEFAMGSSCETSYYKKTVNPYDPNRVPGGSSGGSAAAVAARLVPATLGSDTGGSIRQPAALCNIVGMKPTYGRVSRYGLVAFASSLDQIGPMTKNIQDTADLMEIIGHYDHQDSTSYKTDPFRFTDPFKGSLKGVKIGLPKEYFSEGLSPEVSKAIEDAIRILKQQGVEFVNISMPHTDYAVAVYYIIATAEASSNLARYDGVKYGFRVKSSDLNEMYVLTRSEGFGTEVKRRIMLGTYVLSSGYYDAYYLKAQKVRTLIKKDFLNAYEKVDFIMTPTSPTTAFRLGEKASNPLEMYLSDIYTISLNLFGGCGLSIPAGFDSNNLPIGLQLLGNYFDEDRLLSLALAFEKETEFYKSLPEKFL